MNQFVEMFIGTFVILSILCFVFSIGVVYGLADCPNIIEWIKRKLKSGKEAKAKRASD